MHKALHRFGSGNHTGVPPEIMQAIVSANQKPVLVYCEDEYPQRLTATFKKVFGDTAVMPSQIC